MLAVRQQYRCVLTIAMISALRMLGLFLVLPVFSLYAHQLNGATPTLIGLGIGIYGLTQALLQMPLGYLSDRVGRRPVIVSALLLFSLGSLVCGRASSMQVMILGRAIQGAGAIGSTLIALIADLTDETIRTRAMAILGMVIGLSFSLAIIAGPPLTHLMGFHGLFYLMAGLGIIAVSVAIFKLPMANHESIVQGNINFQLIGGVFLNRPLMTQVASIFCQHLLFTSIFYALPLLLFRQHITVQWHFYLPLMLLGFCGALPAIIIGEKRHQTQRIIYYGVAVTLTSQLGLWLLGYQSLPVLIGCFLTYFIGFNLLEAAIPSQISKLADKRAKGTAMGVYSTSQFLGIFLGGLAAGKIYSVYHLSGIFIMNALVSGLWLMCLYLQGLEPSHSQTTRQPSAGPLHHANS